MPSPRNERGDEPEIELPSLDNYVERVRSNYPGLTDADLDTARRLAHFYRLIDYHGARLELDPADSYSTDLYQKLSTLALRHEDTLAKAKPAAPGDTPPAPIRRT